MLEDVEPIEIHVPLGKREVIKNYATSRGLEVSEYIRGLIEADMQEHNGAIDLKVEPGAPRPKKET